MSIDGTRVRITAALVFLASVLYILAPHWSLAAFLGLDFFLRSFNKGRYSVFAWASGRIAALLRLPARPVDSAPKEFAAQLGFFFSDLLFIFSVLGLYTYSFYFAGLLACFSFLEAAFGLCMGCYAYTFLKRIRLPNGRFSS